MFDPILRSYYKSKFGNGSIDGPADEEWINDGDTHIWVTLSEGRTSPILGVCPNGTVTVDWGDGTTPDILTGTSTSDVQWTPRHNYANPGDYIITLHIDGEIGLIAGGINDYMPYLLRNSPSADKSNYAYASSIKRVELSDGVTSIGSRTFHHCLSLKSVTIPDCVTSIVTNAFNLCLSLKSVTIPDGVTSISAQTFNGCYSLKSVTIPDGVTSIGTQAFASCYSLESVTIPDGVTSIASNTFYQCYSLKSVTIPDGVTSIGEKAFYYCYSLESVTIPDGVTSIGTQAFGNCYSLKSVTIPDGVTSIGAQAFGNCYSVACYDFSECSAIPVLSNSNAFNGTPSDCEIRVPATLYDEWIAATNWATYADYIVAV